MKMEEEEEKKNKHFIYIAPLEEMLTKYLDRQNKHKRLGKTRETVKRQD